MRARLIRNLGFGNISVGTGEVLSLESRTNQLSPPTTNLTLNFGSFKGILVRECVFAPRLSLGSTVPEANTLLPKWEYYELISSALEHSSSWNEIKVATMSGHLLPSDQSWSQS